MGDLVTWTSFCVRVVGQAVDRGQVIYVDEMFIIYSGSGGGPSVVPLISSVIRIPDSDRYVGDPWGK